MKVALSGASGNIGNLLRAQLPRHGIDLRSAGWKPSIAPQHEGEDVVNGDLRDAAFVDRFLKGVDVLIHLAGTSVERPLPEIIENNLIGLHQVYEGARRNNVKRIVFASSNHAFGMHPVSAKLSPDAPFRPDGLYGLSKMWGEGLARMYWDKHGIEGISLRIGSCEPRPSNARHLSTWLSHDDMVSLALSCIRAPAVGYVAVWGVSNNTRSYLSPLNSVEIGYSPRDNAEDFAAEIMKQPNPLDSIAQSYQGGAFVTLDFTPEEERPKAVHSICATTT
ncbi:NAD(P)-dependent oxidoreductase [Bradyrhizobium liaoningense]|uniref:NAD-dependent epimerase/dehydratase family protein n=1 Tax=Bradyrhizobium liaoningense TaxID=43992 RepID=UPI001BAC0050|nr:NAD(P)-dependent oxidoreductase [Bradyrhizobium liaoningense]MBR0713002.1 NAD(P)-dependent oxidoreductase [Bradyrhizobium liaoningense]